MNISISPIKLNNINFRATENGSKDKVAKEKKPLTPQQLMEKRTKLAVGCCLATVFVVDIMYFVMKRNLKHHKIGIQEKNFQKSLILDAKKPLSILDIIDETDNKELDKAYSLLKKYLRRA